MSVISIHKRGEPPLPAHDSAEARKVVQANQKALDALPFGSGTWAVEGVPGLYVRARAHTKSFYIQRRVRGELVKLTLGELTMKAAKERAMSAWTGMKNRVASDGLVTFASALDAYLEGKGAKLRPRTVREYKYVFDHYLADWHQRSMQDIGKDREGVRLLQRAMRRQHGQATSNQVLRLLSCVYRYERKKDPELPECPTVAVELDVLEPRNSALSHGKLREWGQAVSKLNPLKRMWWITCLLTGARQSSICMLKREDVDLDRKITKFMHAKRKAYVVPMSDLLAKLLARYLDAAPPSCWIFPSPNNEGQPLRDVKEKAEKGIPGPHSLRHTFKTLSVALISAEESKLLMGQGTSGDVNYSYITLALIVEPLRPAANKMSDKYAEILPDLLK